MEEQIRQALRQLALPGGEHNVMDLGLVKNLKVMGGIVTLAIELTPEQASLREGLEGDIRRAVTGVRGVQDVAILFLTGSDKKPAAPSGPPEGIGKIIAVGSGKGGVGKSTVSVNLALALSATGAKVGLLDADIYGPSIPMMMGVAGQKPVVVDNKLMPIEAHGVKIMSMGFLLPNADDPVVWRGPMLAGALRQFFQDVAWGELDYLLVDLPPGTGDIPLSLAQAFPLAGVAVVITPQPVAVSIGLKTLRMFQQVNAPILGVIENMSHFTCPHCDKDTPIFDVGGGRRICAEEGLPFLGEIPLDPKIRLGGDSGNPVFVAEPESTQAASFRHIAQAIIAGAQQEKAPKKEPCRDSCGCH